MYQLLQAIGVRKGVNQRWSEIDTSILTLKEYFSLYRKVFFKLENTTGISYLDMNELDISLRDSSLTMSAYLIEIDNQTLPTVESLPHLNTVTAQYKDALRANYKIRPWSALYANNVLVEDRESALLTRTNPETSYSDVKNNCLITVNGFFHLADTDGNTGVVVYDAMKSVRLSKQNSVGIWSFQRVSTLSCIPIASSMLYKLDPQQQYSNDAYLNLGIDISNKFILVVIGGYLHWAADDGFITKVSNTSIKLNMRNYPYIERYYQSKHYIDLSGLETGATGEQVDVNVLKNDSNVEKLLTLSQSFIVVFDKSELFVNEYFVKKVKVPGLYISYIKPTSPLMVGLGRCPEYWVDKENDQFALKVSDNRVSSLIYKTVGVIPNGIDDTQLPVNSEYVGAAKLIEIGSDV